MVTKLNEIDQMLIRYADTMSPAAISFKIEGALTPAQVQRRITQLLDAPDWLTAAQEDQLITQKMRQLVVGFEEMTLTARTGEIMLRALEAVGNRLDKRVAATEKDLSTLYAFQGSVMLDAINVALGHMKATLTVGTDLTEAQWDNAMESALRAAQMELSKHELEN